MAEPMDMGTMNRVIETITTNEEEEKEEINGDVEKETQPLPDIVDVVSQKEACARCGETRKRPCSPIEPEERELNLLEDVDCDSICATVSQLIKSHVHRAAGGCRTIREDLVIWTDFDYGLIKKSAGVREEVVPWKTEGQGYKGSYSMRVTSNRKYGLSPAMQTLVFESQGIIKQMGMNLITIKNEFKQADGTDWPGVDGENSTMKVVVMRYDKIMGLCKKNLKLNTAL